MNSTVLHVPHASVVIPKAYLPSFDRTKLDREISVMTDWFCDELFNCGEDMIVFPVSRLVCDVERFRDDDLEVMAGIGMGFAYTACSDLTPLRRADEQEKRKILREYYDPHHKRLEETVDLKLDQFGKCVIIDCHSFHDVPLPYEMDRDTDRPDFCVGTSDFHTPGAVSSALTSFLRGKGYRVKKDSPFQGTIVPMKHYLKDKHVLSVITRSTGDFTWTRPVAGVNGLMRSEICLVIVSA